MMEWKETILIHCETHMNGSWGRENGCVILHHAAKIQIDLGSDVNQVDENQHLHRSEKAVGHIEDILKERIEWVWSKNDLCGTTLN